MWIVNYLLRNASRVISVVSTYYNRIINSARFALSWAVREANKALGRAKAFALSLIASVRSYALSLWQNVRSFAIGLWNDAKSKAISLFNIAKAVASLALSVLRAYLLGQLASLRAFAVRLVDQAKATLRLFVDARILDRIGGLFDLIPLVRFIKDLRTLLSAENFRRLTDLLTRDFQVISLIVSNPVGYLVAFWRTFMLTFLNFALGYALGTTNRDLPPWPSFGEGGGGPFPGPGPTPGPTPGGLVAPLSRLRISGHRYGPGHLGVDLGCARGATVFAMHNGIIETSGFSSVGYGYQVTIRGGPWWTRYAHLERVNLRSGARVNAGDIVGPCNSTGNSTGNHLHLEIKKNGVFLDPIPLLGLI